MKRVLALLVAFVVILTGTVSAAAASDVRVFVDNQEVKSQVSAYSEDGRTLVPVRALAEALGFTVGWDPAERRITLTKDSSSIVLWVDSTRVLVNGVESTIDVPAKVTNGSTFVPVRFVAEKLGSIVYWDAKANGAKVYSPKGFYKATQASAARPIDQKASYDIDMTQDMASASLPGGKLSTTASIHMDFQQYQGEALMTTTTKIPGVSTAAQTQQLMVRDGKLFMQNPLTGAWMAVGNMDLNNGFDPSSVVKGMPNLTQLDQSLLNGVLVTVGTTEELDGVKVVRLDADMSKLDMQALNAEMAKAAGSSGQSTQVEMKIDHMKFSTWVQPETQFVRKSTADMKYAMTITDKGTTMTMNMDMKMVMTAQPVSEPIQFPAMSGATTKTPSPANTEEAAAYWKQLKSILTTDLKACMAGEEDLFALWSDEQDAAGKQKASDISACYAAVAKKVEALTAPKGWESLHKVLLEALTASAEAYTEFVGAFDPNPDTRLSKEIEANVAIGEARMSLDDAVAALKALAAQYKLD